MDVPEILPIPLQPEIKKNLTPAAVKRSEPPIFDPERDSGHEKRKKKRDRSGRAQPDTPDRSDSPPQNQTERGNRINILV